MDFSLSFILSRALAVIVLAAALAVFVLSLVLLLGRGKALSRQARLALVLLCGGSGVVFAGLLVLLFLFGLSPSSGGGG